MESEFLLKRRAIMFGTRLPDPPKAKVGIARQSEKAKQKLKEQKPERQLLNEWFEAIEEKHGSFISCMECGEWIAPGLIRCATAHLLPKKLFKSVATHELNYLLLGAGCGCHTKTDRIDKFIKMNVWPEAKRRINIMRPLLPFDELKHLSSQLLNALDAA